jgi:hypothetical protein
MENTNGKYNTPGVGIKGIVGMYANLPDVMYA